MRSLSDEKTPVALASVVVLAGLLLAPWGPSGPQAAAAGVPTCDGVEATIVMDERDFEVTGTAGRDVIVGSAENDEIDGAGGPDLICGRGGDDVIDGGTGDDVIWGGGDSRGTFSEGDSMEGGAGDDELHGDLAPDDVPAPTGGPDSAIFDAGTGELRVTLPGSGRRGTATGVGRDTLEDVYDVFSDGTGDHVLRLGPGTRNVNTGEGDDLVVISAPNRAFVLSGSGDDVVRGAESVLLLAGDDRAFGARQAQGGFGNDVITGTPRADELGGGVGADRVDGLAGNDDLQGKEGPDLLAGRSGFDRLDGGAGLRDRCRGGERVVGCP